MKQYKQYIGTRNVPEGTPGCAYNKGIIWEETEDGVGFIRVDDKVLPIDQRLIVRKDTFMKFVKWGWLEPYNPDIEFKWQMETEVSDKHPMGHVNYMYVEEGSQFYVEEGSQFFVKLSGIIQTVKSLRKRLRDKHTKKKTYPSENGERIYCYGTSIKEDVDYLLKGLENSIKNGYEIAQDDLVTKSPPPDGYAVIAVPVGSLIVPPGKEKEWAEKVLRELPPVIDANGPRILTQGELNQFKKIEEEKTKALEDHLFKSNSAENKSPIELISPYVHKFNEEMAKANKEVYPDDFTLYEALAGKKINYHKVPDLDENKEDNTGQKFPPVMYSQDGRRFEILQISSDPWYRTVSKGTISDAKYTAMLRNGFKPHLPMRSREEIQQKINWSINRTGDAVFEADKQKHRAVADILKWVLNEE